MHPMSLKRCSAPSDSVVEIRSRSMGRELGGTIFSGGGEGMGSRGMIERRFAPQVLGLCVEVASTPGRSRAPNRPVSFHTGTRNGTADSGHEVARQQHPVPAARPEPAWTIVSIGGWAGRPGRAAKAGASASCRGLELRRRVALRRSIGWHRLLGLRLGGERRWLGVRPGTVFVPALFHVRHSLRGFCHLDPSARSVCSIECDIVRAELRYILVLNALDDEFSGAQVSVSSWRPIALC